MIPMITPCLFTHLFQNWWKFCGKWCATRVVCCGSYHTSIQIWSSSCRYHIQRKDEVFMRCIVSEFSANLATVAIYYALRYAWYQLIVQTPFILHRARLVNHIKTSEVIRMPYPLQIRSPGPNIYFTKRETWGWTDFLMNPMVNTFWSLMSKQSKRWLLAVA